MKLSVIILNYNVRYFLEQCVRSCERALKGMDGEIIVIDNNSPDDSCEMMKEHFPHITLIENKENVGFSKANNQAVKVAQGEYVCILNPDTAVTEDTFTKSLQYAESLDKLGALGTYLMDGTGNFLPESKRNLPTPKRSLLKLMGKTKGKDGYYATHVPDKENGSIDVLVGAFMLMKRSVYEEVGGFDEDYFMYGEDIDLSYKLTKAGYVNEYFGNVTVLHYKGESTKKDKAYYNRFYGAMEIFYNKHFKTTVLLNMAVKTGVFVAKLFKKGKGRSRKGTGLTSKAIWVFTEDLNLLKKISAVYDTPIKSVSKRQLENATFHNTLCIFDADYVTYRQMFNAMQLLKNKQNSFRIRPSGCNFVIGSDLSDENGGVLEI